MKIATEYIGDRRIDVKEVAKMYGTSARTIWRWLDADLVPKPIVHRKGYTRWLYSEVLAAIKTGDEAAKLEMVS